MLLGLMIAFPAGFVLGYGLGFDPENEHGVGPTIDGAEWLRVALLFVVIALPSIVGVFFGARAIRRGSARGWIGLALNGLLVLGAVWLTFGQSAVGNLTYSPDKLVSVSVSVGTPVADRAYIGVADSRYGLILVDRAGNALYTDEFTPQTWKGRLVSGLDRQDRRVWTRVAATDTVTVDARVDVTQVRAVRVAGGKEQLTYFGHALYTFVGDSPGGFKPFTMQWSKAAGGGPRWADRHVITPSGELIPPPPSG
jgi:hypothetical protein